MNDDSIENSNNIMINFKALAKSISSAQSNIFRCKSTLKCIEEELIYLNVNNNTNTNNKDSKKPQLLIGNSDQGSTPYNMVEIDAEPTKAIDFFSRNYLPDSINKTMKSRKGFSRMHVSQNQDSSNSNFMRNSNGCNISLELNNLMRAQQRLICQIEQLKCEIGDKSGSIDICIRDNQYFNCKFKEVDCDISLLKKDVERIKKDLALASNRDRGFSPYSQESIHKDIPLSFRQPTDKSQGIEHHYGYQDVCTPENSMNGGHSITKNGRSLLLNIRDPQGNSKTFEDLMKKSKLDIDCNINNCRNNQNAASVLNLVRTNPVLQDFACLTNQVKNLRKMAEAIFKGSCSSNNKKQNTCNHAVDSNTPKDNDINQEIHNKITVTKPIAETTLFMLNNQSHPKSVGLVNTSNYTKRDSSSECTSISGSDTSACFCTEDQLTIHSPLRNTSHQNVKSKSQDNLIYDKSVQQSLIFSKINDDKKHTCSGKQSSNECSKRIHVKYKDKHKNCKNHEINYNCYCAPSHNMKSYDICNCQVKNQFYHARSVCPECNKQLTTLQN